MNKWSLGLAAALFLIRPALADNAKPCTLPLAAALPMATDPDGRVTVPASMNGRAVRMLVDTGGIYATVESSLADELKLPRGRAPSQVLAGNVVMNEMAIVDDFQLGAQQARNFSFIVMPSQALTANEDGSVAGSVLSHYDVEFDFAHAKFNLFSQDHCPGAVVYWTQTPYAAVPMTVDREWHITVPVTLNGKEITAVIDSGAANSVMSLETAKSLFGISASDPAMKSVGVAYINGTAGTQVYRYPFAALALQGVTVNNPDITLVAQSAFFRRGGPQLLLGVGVLRQLHVYIAYKEQVLYVTPAEAQ